MTQVADGMGGRPGMALPIRVHDLLLGLAGRLDDDALADARELLASAELDRSLEFLAGCLVAGRIAITAAQRSELEMLFMQVYLNPSVINRLVVDDSAALVRHRFGGGSANGEPAGHGVAEAARRVLDVLPDVRSVWSVWRLTPAGAVSGPVPHRVILVGVGPGGFPPATSYRMENALRRAGIRASVEVLRDGTDAPDYHHSAMQYAAQVPFARQAPTNPAPVRARTAIGQPMPEAQQPQPNRRFRADPPQALEAAVEPPPQQAPQPPPPEPVALPAQPAPSSSLAAETTQFARRARPEPPADPLASAQPAAPAAPLGSGSWLSELPESTTPKPAKLNGHSAGHDHAERLGQPSAADDSLSDQEKHLLRQLQEELARREQEESAAQPLDTRGRHGGGPAPMPHVFDWPSGNPTVINGIPPQQ